MEHAAQQLESARVAIEAARTEAESDAAWAAYAAALESLFGPPIQ